METLDKVTKDHIKLTFMFFSGDIQKTAKSLGISRATLYRKIKLYGLNLIKN